MTSPVLPEDIVAALEESGRQVTTVSRAGRLVWRFWGSGPPVVLAHGAQGSWTHWIRNIEALASTRTVIAVDLPGHGDSGLPACANHRTFVMSLRIGLRQLLGEHSRVDLVGFSFGAVALAHFATVYPDLVRSLVLVGAPGLGTPPGEIVRTSVRGLVGEERQAALKANLLGLMLHNPAAVDDLALHIAESGGRSCRLSSEARAEMVLPDKLIQALPLIKSRVQAIWGEHDRPLPRPDLQERAIRLHHPHLDFQTVADAGHWVMYERPAQFNAVLLKLLSARDRPHLDRKQNSPPRSGKGGEAPNYY